MFYIGCHWGYEDDGYICSSNWMRNTYKRHKEDFKRRIIARIYTNKKDLYEEEFRWLSMIKDEEFKIRYYNLQKWHYNHWSISGNDETIREKLSKAATGRISAWKGHQHTEEAKEKNRQKHLGKKMSNESIEKRKITLKEKGIVNPFTRRSDGSSITKDKALFGEKNPSWIPIEIKQKRKQVKQENLENSWFDKGHEPWNKGREMNEEYRENIRKHSNREKMREIALSRPKVVCPHCQKEGQRNVMMRDHFDKCKFKD